MHDVAYSILDALMIGTQIVPCCDNIEVTEIEANEERIGLAIIRFVFRPHSAREFAEQILEIAKMYQEDDIEWIETRSEFKDQLLTNEADSPFPQIANSFMYYYENGLSEADDDETDNM